MNGREIGLSSAARANAGRATRMRDGGRRAWEGGRLESTSGRRAAGWKAEPLRMGAEFLPELFPFRDAGLERGSTLV